jgi:glutaredoxin 3
VRCEPHVIGMAEVLIYTTPSCGYCVGAKQLLARKGVTYTEIDVSGDHAARRWLAEASGRRTGPQVFIDGQPYGGYTDLVALDRQGRLDGLLKLDAA